MQELSTSHSKAVWGSIYGDSCRPPFGVFLLILLDATSSQSKIFGQLRLLAAAFLSQTKKHMWRMPLPFLLCFHVLSNVFYINICLSGGVQEPWPTLQDLLLPRILALVFRLNSPSLLNLGFSPRELSGSSCGFSWWQANPTTCTLFSFYLQGLSKNYPRT